jgi:small Trp-rich protein
MWFLGAGVVLALLWWADIDPVAKLHWGWIVLPFALAAVWWAVADATGMTQRRAIDKMEKRKVARRERDMKALGLDVRQSERVRVLWDPARKSAPPAPVPAPGVKKGDAPAAEAPRRDPRP